jgi:hypothetical protein
MALSKDKRASSEQAHAFAAKVAERQTLKKPGDTATRVLGWLRPRVGRA